MRLYTLIALFVVFTGYTLSVMVEHGSVGFLLLAGRDPWGMQLLLDLVLMLGLFCAFIVSDAKKHALPTWPYVALTLVMGSMGALVYLIHREVVQRRTRS